jgi:hypothetical protein
MTDVCLKVMISNLRWAKHLKKVIFKSSMKSIGHWITLTIHEGFCFLVSDVKQLW